MHTSEEEHNDAECLAQIQVDARTAQQLQKELDQLYKKIGNHNPAPVAGPNSKCSGSHSTLVNLLDVPMAASSQLPPGSHLHRILTEDCQQKSDSRTQHSDTSLTDDDSNSPSSPSSSGYDWPSISSEPSDPDSSKSSWSRH